MIFSILMMIIAYHRIISSRALKHLERQSISLPVCGSFQNAPHDKLAVAVRQWFAQQKYVAGDFDGISLHINPAGDWQIGGFAADAGLTGRKLAVDNYGPRIPLGGGAFSGKNATKVDRQRTMPNMSPSEERRFLKNQ